MAALGHTGIDLFELALGGNTFGWTSDREASFAVMDAYLDGGGNLIDTADVYSAWAEGHSGGESETMIGEWLASRGRRDDVVIATKVSQHPEFSGLSAPTVKAAAEASLRRLGTDHIDLYYAHFDDAETPLEETVGAFEELVRAGTIRAVGISNYSADRVREWFSIARREGWTLPAALQPHYNLVRRESYEADLAGVAAQENLAVMPYFALASGFLTGKYRGAEDLRGADREQMASGYVSEEGLRVVSTLEEIAAGHGVTIPTVALAWLRSRPTVAAPIASARTTAQLPALMESVRLQLGDDELAALDDVSARVPA